VVDSTMQVHPLTVRQLFEHGRRVNGHREVVTWRGDHARRVSVAETAARTRRRAAGLAPGGVELAEVLILVERG
jgi:hypothetical protein